MVNYYLDHFLDRVWRKRHPDLPLLRMVDDLLVPCRSVKEARLALKSLIALAGSAGFTVKESSEAAIHDLEAGRRVQWLGYDIGGRRDNQLDVRIAESAWRSLETGLERAHEKPHSSLVAGQVVDGWIHQLGPCYPSASRSDTCKRIRHLAQGQAFEEIASHKVLMELWSDAHDSWTSIVDKVRKDCAAEKERQV